jgi:hypothetical protein
LVFLGSFKPFKAADGLPRAEESASAASFLYNEISYKEIYAYQNCFDE